MANYNGKIGEKNGWIDYAIYFFIIFVIIYIRELFPSPIMKESEYIITPMILTYTTSILIFLDTSKLLTCCISIKFKQKNQN